MCADWGKVSDYTLMLSFHGASAQGGDTKASLIPSPLQDSDINEETIGAFPGYEQSVQNAITFFTHLCSRDCQQPPHHDLLRLPFFRSIGPNHDIVILIEIRNHETPPSHMKLCLGFHWLIHLSKTMKPEHIRTSQIDMDLEKEPQTCTHILTFPDFLRPIKIKHALLYSPYLWVHLIVTYPSWATLQICRLSQIHLIWIKGVIVFLMLKLL